MAKSNGMAGPAWVRLLSSLSHRVGTLFPALLVRRRPARQVQEILFINDRAEPVRLLLEPWYEQCILAPGASVIARIEDADPSQKLEVVLNPEGIAFWGLGVTTIIPQGPAS